MENKNMFNPYLIEKYLFFLVFRLDLANFGIGRIFKSIPQLGTWRSCCLSKSPGRAKDPSPFSAGLLNSVYLITLSESHQLNLF